MAAATNWTHTATLVSSNKAGAQQTRPGEVVELFHNPAKQQGEWITFRRASGHTGSARISDLIDVRKK